MGLGLGTKIVNIFNHYKNVVVKYIQSFNVLLKANFQAWSKAGGVTLRGLYNRRTEEYNIFANSDYTRNL